MDNKIVGLNLDKFNYDEMYISPEAIEYIKEQFEEDLKYNFPVPLKSTESINYTGSPKIWKHEMTKEDFVSYTIPGIKKVPEHNIYGNLMEIQTKHKCICDFHTVIMVTGCQCGGI